MAHSIAGAFKSNKNDNLCTPKILVEALKPYFEKWLHQAEHEGQYHLYGEWYPTVDRLVPGIPTKEVKQITVWCPFDKELSEFVLFFKENFPVVKVVYSHIDDGQDFFEYEPEHYDIICSNPPFSRKLDVFKRLNKLGKPWVMLSNVMCLNYMEIGNYFADNPVQLLIPDKRVSFDGNPSSFCSAFFCKDFLPSSLEFCHLEHCNSGKDFTPSRMLTE